MARERRRGPIESIRPLADEIREWFFSDARDAAVAWAAIVVVLSAVLVWFFAVSPYGAPAAPVYAAF